MPEKARSQMGGAIRVMRLYSESEGPASDLRPSLVPRADAEHGALMTSRCPRRSLLVLLLVFLAIPALAERPSVAERRANFGYQLPQVRSPMFLRSAGGTTWVRVHLPAQSPCAPADTSGSHSAQTIEEVWCFEGAGGDSTWPAIPAGQGTGSRHDGWDHWSKFAPPLPSPSKWHVSGRHGGASTGAYNAWCGCDSVGANPSCTDVAFWIFKDGYGDDWNYALTLDMAGQNASGGGTIRFDLRYDSECHYDYAYLEYFNTSTSQWVPVRDGVNKPATFNSVSGNACTGHGGTGRCCGGDYFFASDEVFSAPQYGTSTWLAGVTFPLPTQAGGMKLRWRCTSDGAWSDADGAGDTDGIAAIDNVQITFTAPTPDVVVSDNFETGNFSGVTTTSGSATWTPGGLTGSTYDGWHLEFDSKYKNKGNTCEFSNDWMWAAKPAATAIPANGFDYFLVTPVIDVNGWTGGLVELSSYFCTPSDRTDYATQVLRWYDAAIGHWSLWSDFDTFMIWDPGCLYWTMNDTELLTPFLGPNIDSLQVAWELIDTDKPGDLSWGSHIAVQYLIDNVSIGSYDATATVFQTSTITIFSDTFSRADPAHTSQLKNKEEGNWIGNGGTRAFASVDSLAVQVEDVDGITSGNVDLHWRAGQGTPPTFGAWNGKPMVYSMPNPLSPTDEGTYRSTVGNTTTEDYSANEAGSLSNPNIDPIWNSGVTVEYYVKVTDNAAEEAVFPDSADDLPTPVFLRFQVLPFSRLVGSGGNARRILVVDDYERENLDFQNSSGFHPPGPGFPFGGFDSPAYDQSEDMVERALALIYGGTEDFFDGPGGNYGTYGSPKWDIYNVQGAGSSQQREPRVRANAANGVGGICSDAGVPFYDAVIWLNGSFDVYSFADTTRIELKTFLDHGGHLFSSGDDVAAFLGTGGSNADSVVNFLGPYLGISFPSVADDECIDRVLSVQGATQYSLGLYGDCPGLRHAFDKLTLAPSTPGVNAATVLATYQDGDASTNGRAAIVKNVRVASNGVAVHCGFAIESLTSDTYRAMLLGCALRVHFGLPAGIYSPGCVPTTDAPELARVRFGFDLAQASPNPFSDATVVRFSVPTRSPVRIEIYNILGERVRTLVEETLDANVHVREWNGRTDSGARLSSGIYFVRMAAGEYSATRKVVRLN